MRVADDYADMSIAIGKDIGGAGASLLAMLVTLPSCTTVVLCIVPGAAALVFVEQIGEGLVDVIKTKKMQDEAFSIFIQLTKPGTPGLGKVTLHD